MTGRGRRTRTLVAALAAVAAAGSLTQVAGAAPAPPAVPADIEVTGDYKLFLVGHAVGVQSYPCSATSSGYAWGASTPQANLYDDGGKLLMTHFGGPTWQARDGSKAIGQVVARATVPNAIPWLRLSATGSAGVDGDRLAGTKFIQRIATTGGLAPAAADCDAATLGTVRAIPYTADYYFWKATGA
jgi:hypothetical protein